MNKIVKILFLSIIFSFANVICDQNEVVPGAAAAQEYLPLLKAFFESVDPKDPDFDQLRALLDPISVNSFVDKGVLEKEIQKFWPSYKFPNAVNLSTDKSKAKVLQPIGACTKMFQALLGSVDIISKRYLTSGYPNYIELGSQLGLGVGLISSVINSCLLSRDVQLLLYLSKKLFEDKAALRYIESVLERIIQNVKYKDDAALLEKASEVKVAIQMVLMALAEDSNASFYQQFLTKDSPGKVRQIRFAFGFLGSIVAFVMQKKGGDPSCAVRVDFQVSRHDFALERCDGFRGSVFKSSCAAIAEVCVFQNLIPLIGIMILNKKADSLDGWPRFLLDFIGMCKNWRFDDSTKDFAKKAGVNTFLYASGALSDVGFGLLLERLVKKDLPPADKFMAQQELAYNLRHNSLGLVSSQSGAALAEGLLLYDMSKKDKIEDLRDNTYFWSQKGQNALANAKGSNAQVSNDLAKNYCKEFVIENVATVGVEKALFIGKDGINQAYNLVFSLVLAAAYNPQKRKAIFIALNALQKLWALSSVSSKLNLDDSVKAKALGAAACGPLQAFRAALSFGKAKDYLLGDCRSGHLFGDKHAFSEGPKHVWARLFAQECVRGVRAVVESGNKQTGQQSNSTSGILAKIWGYAFGGVRLAINTSMFYFYNGSLIKEKAIEVLLNQKGKTLAQIKQAQRELGLVKQGELFVNNQKDLELLEQADFMPQSLRIFLLSRLELLPEILNSSKKVIS